MASENLFQNGNRNIKKKNMGDFFYGLPPEIRLRIWDTFDLKLPLARQPNPPRPIRRTPPNSPRGLQSNMHAASSIAAGASSRIRGLSNTSGLENGPIPLIILDTTSITAAAYPLGQRRSLAILRTCKALYNEVIVQVYRHASLTFWITGDYFPWLRICFEPQLGIPRREDWVQIRDKDDFIARGFSRLPYWQLGKLQVLIHPPGNQGQMICLHYKIRDLVSILSSVSGGIYKVQRNVFREVHIQLLAVLPAQPHHLLRWCDGQKHPRMTITPMRPNIIHNNDHSWTDYHIILSTFWILRKVERVHVLVRVNDQLENDRRVKNAIDCTVYTMTRRIQFGQLEGDDWLQDRMDRIYVQFEEALDEADDPTARLLRRDRFATWYNLSNGESTYEKNMLRILERGSSQMLDQSTYRVRLRIWFLLILNPESARMRLLRRSDLFVRYQLEERLWTEPTFLALMYKVRYRSTFIGFGFRPKDEWDSEVWKTYYSTGLPTITGPRHPMALYNYLAWTGIMDKLRSSWPFQSTRERDCTRLVRDRAGIWFLGRGTVGNDYFNWF